MPEKKILCSGLIERIGFDDAKFIFKTDKNTIEVVAAIPNHKVGLELLSKQLLDKETGVSKLRPYVGGTIYFRLDNKK